MTEDKMVEWYHRLNEYEFEQTLGDGEGQGSLACCSPWGLEKLDTTWQLNNKEGMLESSPLVIYNVILFENKVFTEVIKLK